MFAPGDEEQIYSPINILVASRGLTLPPGRLYPLLFIGPFYLRFQRFNRSVRANFFSTSPRGGRGRKGDTKGEEEEENCLAVRGESVFEERVENHIGRIGVALSSHENFTRSSFHPGSLRGE